MMSNVFLFLQAQQVNTLYFMEDVPVRHILNPSFQPESDFYLSLPVVGYTQFSIGNNSLSLKDLVYNVNGQTISFLNPLGDIPRFYKTLKPNTTIRTDFQTNLFSFGFRHKNAYWIFSLTEKLTGTVNLPKDIFGISLFGTPNPQNNSFDFSKTEGDISAYTEAAIGYSKKMNDKWIIGGKIKLLIGTADISNYNNSLLLQAGVSKWHLTGAGTTNYSGPVQINTTNNIQSFTYTMPVNYSGWIKPSGLGAGIDIGVEYLLNKNVKLSGAIIDAGFIRWSRNVQNYHYGVDYTFSGIKLFDSNSTINTFQDVLNQFVLNNGLVDSITTAFGKSSASTIKSLPYTTFTTAKINLGFEYGILNNKINLGLLSYSQLFNNILNEELTCSVNARPYSWLNASVSYSVFNGRMSTLGVGLGLKTGIFQWFVAADFIPFQKATLKLSDFGANYPDINIPIPYNSTSFNFSAGMNIVLNKKINMKKGLVHLKNMSGCNCDWE